MPKRRAVFGFVTVAILGLCLAVIRVVPTLAASLTGAIFTTDSSCTGVNVNIFNNKEDVYIDGGPPRKGAAGLPDGYYYVKVTTPDGTLLGTSIGSGNDTPVHVTNGKFDKCYQLWAILIKASDGSQGYDNTTNPGGEYKVWVSQYSDFPSDASKTDNFKVKGQVQPAQLEVIKFYDANANGVNDDGQLIEGWKVHIFDDIDWVRFTPVSILLAPNTYTVTEFLPNENNWMPTTATSVQVTLQSGQTTKVEFGNVCLGPGGGKTLGFWSNKNGQALIDANDLAFLRSLNLRNADGSDFDPTTYDAFRTWLLNANATNMAYMLSAQLAAMELNVRKGLVNGNALIYAPGTNSANPLGFATVNAVMNEANTELGAHGYTPAGNPYRAYQEALKNALDNANNNLTFVQPTPCTFTFP